MTFKQLQIGDTFDWINPTGDTYNSFFERCTKVDAYRYTGETAIKYRVGSLSAKVYHVETAAS